MKQRFITGTVYVLVLIAFFLLKCLLPQPWSEIAFDGLLYLFSVIGTFEMTRALKNELTPEGRVICMVFAVVFLPIFLLCTPLGFDQNAVMGATFFLFAAIFVALLVIKYETTTMNNTAMGLLCMVYPVLFIGVIALCNHLSEYSVIALLFIFVISPCADTFAYLSGMSLGKKFPKKASPAISPNKTVVGCTGGVIGGMVAATALYFIYNGVVYGAYDYMLLPVYILLGAGASLATEFGDLVESAIKRKVGIKDMGDLMPGHGGVLDRIDGSMFEGVLVYVVFYILSVLV